jgi:hypothetical protein
MRTCTPLAGLQNRNIAVYVLRAKLERGRRIELLALAWKAKVLPLYEPRKEPSTAN